MGSRHSLWFYLNLMTSILVLVLIMFDLVTPDSGFKSRVRVILVGFSGFSGSENGTENDLLKNVFWFVFLP